MCFRVSLERGYMNKLYTIRELIYEAITAIMKIHNSHHAFKKCDCQNILNQLNEYAELFDFRVAQEMFKK
jgi:hypothetical protein